MSTTNVLDKKQVLPRPESPALKAARQKLTQADHEVTRAKYEAHRASSKVERGRIKLLLLLKTIKFQISREHP
jgi:hypothetical protein